jgi:hypothetical protein
MRDNIFGWGNANKIGRDTFSRNHPVSLMYAATEDNQQ